MRSLPTTCLALFLLAIGCVDTAEVTETGLDVVVEDSAGVAIVQNARPAPDSRLHWEFGAQPSVSIGSVAGGEANELFRVSDATRLPDGRIVIANSGSGELRVFNPDGSHDGTWGGRGEGPGEFSGFGPAVVAHWPGDSIFASDAVGRPRVSLFDLNGDHGRDMAVDATRSGLLDVLPDGRIVSRGSEAFREAGDSEGLVRLDTEWSVLEVDGTLLAPLGRFPMVEVFMSTFMGGEINHPLQRRAEGTVWGDLVAVGVPYSYEIKAFAADGSLARIVRRDWDPRTPTEAEIEEFHSRTRVARLPEQPPVDSYPAFERVLGDRVGYLWVREYRMYREGPVVWTVFDPEGRVHGLVETPDGLNVFEIGVDYVLGRAADELGVEYVQLWALSRGVGAG